MADAKWSNDTKFVPQSLVGSSDDIMGLTSGNVNAKYPSSLFSTSNSTNQTPTMSYVATNGNDSNIGTIAFPKLTIQDAVSSASANTQVNVAPGTYSFTGNFQMGSDISLVGADSFITNYNVTGNIGLNNTQWIGSVGPLFQIKNLSLSASGTVNFTPSVFMAGSYQEFDNINFGNNLVSGNVTTYVINNCEFFGMTLTDFQTLMVTGGITLGGNLSLVNSSVGTSIFVSIENFDFGNGNLLVTTSNATFNIIIRNCKNLNSITYNDSSLSINSSLTIDLASYPASGITNSGTGTLSVIYSGDEIPSSSIVKTSGTQSIAGVKTFTDPTLLKEVQNPLVFNRTIVGALTATSGTLTNSQIASGEIFFAPSGGNATWQLPTGGAMDTILNTPSANRGMLLRLVNQSSSENVTITSNTGFNLNGLTVSGTLFLPFNSEVFVTINKVDTTPTYQLNGSSYGSLNFLQESYAHNTTWSGIWASAQTGNCIISRISNVVTMRIPTISATSNTASNISMTTTLPSQFLPALDTWFVSNMQIGASSWINGTINVQTSGNITAYSSGSKGNFSSGVASGIMGTTLSWSTV